MKQPEYDIRKFEKKFKRLVSLLPNIKTIDVPERIGVNVVLNRVSKAVAQMQKFSKEFKNVTFYIGSMNAVDDKIIHEGIDAVIKELSKNPALAGEVTSISVWAHTSKDAAHADFMRQHGGRLD